MEEKIIGDMINKHSVYDTLEFNKDIKRLKKTFLVDMIKEIEQEIFYERTANQITKKIDFLDAAHVVDFLRKKL
jgi:hypothetical protein